MKKIILSIIIGASLVSCDDYLDVNTNPNSAQEVQNSLLIPSAQNFIASAVGGDIHNTAAFFAQYTDQMPESNQYNDLAEYSFDKDLFNRSYSNLYAGALMDLEVIRKQATAENNGGDYFLATVLRAYVYQILVDYMDQAPYSEALKGNEIPLPHWESGESIYDGILTELDEAQAKLDKKSYISGDLLLGKDISKWIQFANSIRLRIYMRSSNVKDNSVAIKKLIDENNFIASDIKFAMYTDEANKRNPWYTTNYVALNTTNHVGSYAIISYLQSTDDTRIADIYLKAAASGNYAGELPGSKTKQPTAKNSAYSALVEKPLMPVYLITSSEIAFFKSEAYLRFYSDDAAAKTAYEAAIDSNFVTRGLAPTAIYANGNKAAWSSATTTDEKLELIGMQKWVALCMLNNAEAWSEVRRMGYPKLSASTASQIKADGTVYTPGNLISPWVNLLGEGKLVKRLYVPLSAVNTNKNTPQNQDRTTLVSPVWWDNK